ncbi:MAG TPA: hypothetical protein VFX35_01605 [Solirubrobacterales bacterium]|nr:hypothetical protein [Solirubrobacterales bacterium]
MPINEKYAGAVGRAREQRDKIRGKSSLELRIPDYEDLQISYKLMSEKVTEEVAKQIQKAQRSERGNLVIDAAVNFLISACRAVQVRSGESGKFEDLVDDEDQPVRFDETLAEFLGFEFETAKDVLLETFSPKGDEDGLRRNPDAPMDHFQALASWRRGRAHEIDSDLLGES